MGGVGQMPTKQVIAVLNSQGPAQAADALLGMPGGRIDVILADMTPAEIARMLDGARPDRKVDLLSAIGRQRTPVVLAQLKMHQLTDLVSSLPLPAAVSLLRGMPAHSSAELLLEIPTQRRRLLQDELAARPPYEFIATQYLEQVEESVFQVATRVARLERPGDLVAEVMGRRVHVALRHRPDDVLSVDELRTVAASADWRQVCGVMVLTNAPVDGAIQAALRELRQYGHRVDVVQWQDGADDGAFKRALVRLMG